MIEWTRYKNGRGWLVLPDGRILAEFASDVHPSHAYHDFQGSGETAFEYRTKGNPSSMIQLLADYGPIIEHASKRFGIAINTICALIAIEASRMSRDHLRFDPRSVRLEPGYTSDKRTPNKVSPGLMQTLLSTANDMLASGMLPEFGHEKLIDRHDLFVPNYSILFGAAYIRWQIERVEGDEEELPHDDPILNAVAAYNAGSVRHTSANDWHLVTYGRARIDKFIAYNNDTLSVLMMRDHG